MESHVQSTIKNDYPFLAHPPQAPQGTRRRSSTFSAIAAWAAHVQPGSPTSLSPCSPYRSPSLRQRRPSIASIRTPSASFLHIVPAPTTATPTACNFKANLTSVGYTSVFLPLPNTPASATIAYPVPLIPSPTRKPRGFSRFRSLSALRSRGRSKSTCPDTPTKVKAKAAMTSASVVKRKKAKYALRPPPLVNELALMQFAEGGSMDDNIKRAMEAQAKAAGATGLADVYRDGVGGVWWDQDEELEYAHLLGDGEEFRSRITGSSDFQWVTFDGSMSPSATSIVPGDERRGSVSTQDSDYVVKPTEVLDCDDLVLFGGAITTRKAVSVLSVPSRPRRAAKHLRKPDFLVDVAFSLLQDTPQSPALQNSLLKTKGKTRRRPAPLKLSPPSPARKRPTNSPIDTDKIRRDFIEASFEPMVLDLTSMTPTPMAAAGAACLATPTENMPAQPIGCNRVVANMPWQTVNGGLRNLGISMKRKQSALNMKGLFKSAAARGEDGVVF